MDEELKKIEVLKLEVQAWQKTIGTQEHFNQMILQVRNHLLTIVTAIFLTGRTEDLREATEQNLIREGFAKYEDIYLKPMHGVKDTQAFKDATREKLKASGRIIVLSIGDHLEDLDTKSPRGNFLLPNPFY